MTAVLTRTRPAAPSTARIAVSRVGLELRLFSRERQQVLFSFAHPVVMLVVFSSVLGGDVEPGDAPMARELEVLAGVARGLTNAEIGRELFIGEATVKTHLLRVFAKLVVDDRTRAVMIAVERKRLPSPGQ
jgi:ATP/maltotriose-dependent transcriptional regulator MalT